MPFRMWGGVGQSDHVLDPPGEGAILGAFLCLITVTERHHSVVLQIWPEQKLQSQKNLGRHGLPWPLIKSAYGQQYEQRVALGCEHFDSDLNFGQDKYQNAS